MQIPEYFKNKIVRSFGEKGEKWLEELPQILNKSIDKWNLTNCKLSSGLSYNLIFFAKSPKFGDVSVKIGVPHPELYTEMKALSLYQGRNICKCYEVDMELGALLLERIIPGDNLTVLQSKKKQLMIAADLICKLPIQVKDVHGFPTYSDWITRAFNRAKKENIVGNRMLSLIDMAEKMSSEIESGAATKVLLHGDLHHWNILRDENGSWKAIDPKGVIGMPCMESARFIDNHIDELEGLEKLSCLDEAVTVFSIKFGETKRTIAIFLFVLSVLSTCWTFEEANPENEKLIASVDNCEFILEYIRNISKQ